MTSTDLVRVRCRHCLFGSVQKACMGGERVRCPKCRGKGYRWIPRGTTESDYDAALAGDGASLESIIDGLTVDRPGGM